VADAMPMDSEPAGMWGPDKIDVQMGYHPAIPATIPLYEANRAAAITYAKHLDTTCPPGPELTLALRAVEESLMRANQAVAITLTPLEAPGQRTLQPHVESVAHNRLEQTLTITARIPDGLEPEQVAGFIGSQVAEQLVRNGASHAEPAPYMAPRRMKDNPQV
jgi:hypothetical protein